VRSSFTDLYYSARTKAETVVLTVWDQRISSYRIDIASQVANIVASLSISTDEVSAVCVGEVAVLELSFVHSADGGGGAMGGVSVSPANAIPARETMRVEMANSRLSLVIMLSSFSLKGRWA
jgi:hypothetical protein